VNEAAETIYPATTTGAVAASGSLLVEVVAVSVSAKRRPVDKDAAR